MTAMNCEQCKPHLIDHAFGELPAATAQPVARHLAECPDCALEFCRLRADLDGVAEAYQESPEPQVAQQLRARVKSEFAPPWWQRMLAPLRRPVPVYGALAAAVLPVAIWIGIESVPRRAHTDQPTPQRSVLIDAYDASTVLRADPNLL